MDKHKQEAESQPTPVKGDAEQNAREYAAAKIMEKADPPHVYEDIRDAYIAGAKVDKEIHDDFYPGKPYQRLFNAICDIGGSPLNDEMNEIIQIVHEDFPPETEPEAAPKGDVKSKEEILNTIVRDWTTPISRMDAFSAMEEYANQRAKGFSLEDMLDCWEKCTEHCAACFVGGPESIHDKYKYFKEKFNIDITQKSEQ